MFRSMTELLVVAWWWRHDGEGIKTLHIEGSCNVADVFSTLDFGKPHLSSQSPLIQNRQVVFK